MRAPFILSLASIGALGLAAGVLVGHRLSAGRSGPGAAPSVVEKKIQTSAPTGVPAVEADRGRWMRRLRAFADGGPALSRRELEELLATATPEDVRALLPLVVRVPRTQKRWDLQSGLLRVWAAEEPLAALAWLEAEVPVRQRRSLLGAVLSGWAEKDPLAALARARSAGAIWESGMRFNIVDTWAGNDPPAALAWYRQLPPGRARWEVGATLIRALARNDPTAALTEALGMPAFYGRDMNVASVVSQMARTDLGAALQTVEKLPATVSRSDVLGRIVASLVKEDPKLAGEFALTLPVGSGQTDALSTVINEFAARDPQAALAWIDASVPVGAGRTTALQSAIIAWAEQDPAAAKAWLLQSDLPAEWKQKLLGP